MCRNSFYLQDGLIVYVMKWSRERKRIIEDALRRSDKKVKMSNVFQVYTGKTQAKDTVKVMRKHGLLEKAEIDGEFYVNIDNVPEDKFPEFDFNSFENPVNNNSNLSKTRSSEDSRSVVNRKKKAEKEAEEILGPQVKDGDGVEEPIEELRSEVQALKKHTLASVGMNILLAVLLVVLILLMI